MADVWDALAGCDGLLVLAPHPDDEIYGIGGLLLLASRRGLAIEVVAVTDGDASHANSMAITRQALIARRLEEVERAYDALGISPERRRLRLPDAGVTEAELLPLLRSFLQAGTALVAPLPDDGHSDHNACGRVAAILAREAGLPYFAYPVWAYFQNPETLDCGRTALRTELPVDVLAAKARAIACFESQYRALGPAPADGPVLPPGFEVPFLSGWEALYQ